MYFGGKLMQGNRTPVSRVLASLLQNTLTAPSVQQMSVCAEQVQLQEVAVCFGGKLMRGNRCQKVDASGYQAFDSPTYHKLALLGVEVDWQQNYLLQVTLLVLFCSCLCTVLSHRYGTA